MKVVSEYPDGLFNWIDLATSDVAGAKAFYHGVFGWEADDIPIDTGGVYTMFRIDGHTVAGMGELSPDLVAQGVPSNWTSYVKHSDVDRIAEKVTAAGGQLMFPPMDVMTEGRMFMATDPTGAPFGVWQPKEHIGAEIVNQPNSLVWNELQTRDAASSQAFYEAVFGWATSYDENGYGMYAADERIQAGMLLLDAGMGSIPPHWQAYFMVDDIQATVEKIQSLGGAVHVPIFPMGQMGQAAVVADPQGAVFTIGQFNAGMVDTPPGHG